VSRLVYIKKFYILLILVLKEADIAENGFYHTIPDCGELENIPFCLSVSSALRLVRELSGLKVQYRVEYAPGKAGVPLPRPVELALRITVERDGRIKTK
jgi:hypothetical protein